jgi:membrane fusion protein (multidrug efflux system)
MRRATSFILILTAGLLVACQKGGDAPGNVAKAAAVPAENPPIMVAAEDVQTIHSGAIASGTVITGTIVPERRADLRAEVSAVILQVLKENGETTHRGDLLIRLDDTAIRDALTSTEAAERASVQALDQAERQFQRIKTLRASGMASAQQVDDAERTRNNAQSDKVGAESRVVQARQQLQRTEVRAPFDGVVSERKASAGDTAAVGKELVKVIDPTSIRFEGFVSADKIGTVKLGQNVSFQVNGYGQQEFTGTVKRIDAAADPTTRQVSVIVNFTDKVQPSVSGLYAEGRVETSSSSALILPASALVSNGDHAYVWQVKGDALKKKEITLGPRDTRHGDYPILGGLSDGDVVMRNPQSSLKDGAKVQMIASANVVAKKGN